MKEKLVLTVILGGIVVLPIPAMNTAPTVTIYIDYDTDIPNKEVFWATSPTSRMFSKIGTPVQFRSSRKAQTVGQTGRELDMYVGMQVPRQIHSNALGMGQTESGTAPQPLPKPDEWPQQMQHALDRESVGDFAGAERTLVASIHEAEQPASDPSWLPTALDRLGLLNWDLGRIRQAEQFYLRAADLWRTRFGPSSLGLATTLSDLAWVYVGLGDPPRAEALWRSSLEMRTVILGPSHPTVAEIYGYMAVNAFAAHQLGDAESFCQQALRIYERSGKVPGETDRVLSSLASVRLRQGRTAEAAQLMTEAIHLQQTAKQPSIRRLGGYRYNLALPESAAARPADAEAHFQQALSLLAAPPYATQTLRFNVLSSYAQFLSDAGRKKEAKTVQKQASDLTQLIRRESFAGYVADVSSFR